MLMKKIENSEIISVNGLCTGQSLDIYPYGKSIIECNIDNCPIEVFKPECNYYKSLIGIINRYSESVKDLESRIEIINGENDYVKKHFNERYTEEEEYCINADDFVIPDKNEYMDHLSESVDGLLRREYRKKFNVCPDEIPLIENNLIQYREVIKENEQDLIEWKECMLMKAKDEEKELLKKRLKVPHSKEDIILHIRQFVNEKIGFEFGELHCYYISLIVDVINGCVVEELKNKYDSTIKSVITERGETNFFKIFDKHNDLIKTQLSKLSDFVINHLNEKEMSEYDDSYFVVEETIKKSFDDFISRYFMKLAEILRLKIQTINIGNGISSLDVTGSVSVKNITRIFVSKVTKLMKEEVEGMIYIEFKQYFESLKEKCNYKQLILMNEQSSGQGLDSTEHDNEVQGFAQNNSVVESFAQNNSVVESFGRSSAHCEIVEESKMKANEQNLMLCQTKDEQSLEVKIDFLDFVDFDTKYSIKELTELYNKVHKTTLSTISVGKLSYIRQHFEKKRETNPMTHKQEYMYKLK